MSLSHLHLQPARGCALQTASKKGLHWDRNQMLGWFLNIPQYLLVNMQCVIQFRSSFSHIHLQPAGGCALQIASKKGLHTRKGARLTSHMNKLGGSLTCLLEYSSLVVNKVNGMVPVSVTRIFCHSVTCLGTDQCWNRKHMPRHVHECSAVLACKGAVCDLVSKQPFPWNTCNLHVAAPCRLHPRKDYTQGKEHFSLHTWRSWVVLWHVCFKTAWVFLTCHE